MPSRNKQIIVSPNRLHAMSAAPIGEVRALTTVETAAVAVAAGCEAMGKWGKATPQIHASTDHASLVTFGKHYWTQRTRRDDVSMSQ